MISIIDAVRDDRLLGDNISPQQECILRAVYGMSLQPGTFKTRRLVSGRHAEEVSFDWVDETAEEFLSRCMGGRDYVPRYVRNSGIYLGARAGKSDKIAANITIYEAAIRQHRLSLGERALVPCIAVDKKQASVVLNYIRGKMKASPSLSQLIVAERAEEIELSCNVVIGVYPCSFRQLRGYSIPAAALDEIAVWRDEVTRANPAREVIRSIRRGMATFPDAKMAKISSPYSKSGVVWDECLSPPGDSLILRAPSWEINPTLEEESLEAEFKSDPELFWREFGAEFWDSIAPLVPAEKVAASVARGIKERAPIKGIKYTGVIDVAFKHDEFTFGVFHRAGEKVIQDVLRVWRGSVKEPVKMREVLLEISSTCRAYLVSSITGDQFCSEPIRQGLGELGIEFNQFSFTVNSKQQIYGALRAMIMSGTIEILDDKESIEQIRSLEAVAMTGGMVRVQASAGHRDDRATVVALGGTLVMQVTRGAESWIEALRLIISAPERMAIPVAEERGRTRCSDCGRLIALGEEYYGLGPSVGQCMNCSRDHGAPTMAAIPALRARPPRPMTGGPVT